MTLGERIKEVRKSLKLTQREFADKLKLKQNSIAQVEGGRNTSDQTIRTICREFNVSESWLRTGSGDMFVPKKEDALDELVKQKNLSDSDRILIEKFLNLKPAEREAVIGYITDIAEKINAAKTPETAEEIAPAAPVVISKTETTTPAPDTSEQERTESDVTAELAELKRQNQALAAKVAAMEEEDARMEAAAELSAWPSVSAGSLSPVDRAKK